MAEDGEAPVRRPRTWQEIATELSTEINPQRILDLSIELNRALDGHFGSVQDVFRPGAKKPASKAPAQSSRSESRNESAYPKP
jgi:hypothetical protein